MWTDPGWFIHQLKVRICLWSSAFPLCILVLYGELIPSSLLNYISSPSPVVCLKWISPPGGLVEDFNKQNCLPVNELNINGVTKKNLRFWTKISFLERVSIPSAWSYIWHTVLNFTRISAHLKLVPTLKVQKFNERLGRLIEEMRYILQLIFYLR